MSRTKGRSGQLCLAGQCATRLTKLRYNEHVAISVGQAAVPHARAGSVDVDGVAVFLRRAATAGVRGSAACASDFVYDGVLISLQVDCVLSSHLRTSISTWWYRSHASRANSYSTHACASIQRFRTLIYGRSRAAQCPCSGSSTGLADAPPST